MHTPPRPNLETEMLRNLLRRMTVLVLSTVPLEDKPELMAVTGEATDILSPPPPDDTCGITYVDPDDGIERYLDGRPSGHGALDGPQV